MEIKNNDYKAYLQNCSGSKISQVKNLTSKCDSEITKITKTVEDITDYEIIMQNVDEFSDLEKEINKYSQKIEDLKKEIEENQEEFAVLHNKYTNGEITKEEFDEQSAEIDSRNKTLHSELFSCMNQQNLLQQSIESKNENINLEAESLDNMRENAEDELNYSEALAEVTSDKASDLIKNNKTNKWLGFLTLGITTIVAAVRESVSKAAKTSSNNLVNLNNELKSNLENNMTGKDFINLVENNNEVPLPSVETNISTNPTTETTVTEQDKKEEDGDNKKLK